MIALTSLSVAVLMSVACLTGPDDSTPPGPPWETIDSSWKVIDNLEYAYNAMDIDLYMSCFREDFEFHLLWYNPFGKPAKQDSFWGYDIEELFHQNMFAYVDSIELSLSGTQENPWSGDTTGQSYMLPRTFDFKVYCEPTQAGYYRATGTALFICRQDSTSEWYVWLWYDQSDTKEWATWGEIKSMF